MMPRHALCVEDWMILYGKTNDCGECPIALAVRQMCEREKIYIWDLLVDGGIYITTHGGSYRLYPSDRAQEDCIAKFIEAFDNGREVNPFCIELDLEFQSTDPADYDDLD